MQNAEHDRLNELLECFIFFQYSSLQCIIVQIVFVHLKHPYVVKSGMVYSGKSPTSLLKDRGSNLARTCWQGTGLCCHDNMAPPVHIPGPLQLVVLK